MSLKFATEKKKKPEKKVKIFLKIKNTKIAQGDDKFFF